MTGTMFFYAIVFLNYKIYCGVFLLTSCDRYVILIKSGNL